MDELYGWRAKIGIVAPVINFVTTYEWPKVLPEGVTFWTAITGLTETTPEGLKEMRNKAVPEAIKLSYGAVDIILFACTSGSFIGGPGYDEEIINDIERATGIPATTTSSCVLNAFADLGIKRIGLIGPYIPEVFDIEVKFFAHHGIETGYLKGLGYRATRDISLTREKPYLYYRLAKEAFHSEKDIDAIFITCMASPALKIIEPLEQEIGIPVISSNSASLYGVLKKLGIKGANEKYGKVFKGL